MSVIKVHAGIKNALQCFYEASVYSGGSQI